MSRFGDRGRFLFCLESMNGSWDGSATSGVDLDTQQHHQIHSEECRGARQSRDYHKWVSAHGWFPFQLQVPCTPNSGQGLAVGTLNDLVILPQCPPCGQILPPGRAREARHQGTSIYQVLVALTGHKGLYARNSSQGSPWPWVTLISV